MTDVRLPGALPGWTIAVDDPAGSLHDRVPSGQLPAACQGSMAARRKHHLTTLPMSRLSKTDPWAGSMARGWLVPRARTLSPLRWEDPVSLSAGGVRHGVDFWFPGLPDLVSGVPEPRGDVPVPVLLCTAFSQRIGGSPETAMMGQATVSSDRHDPTRWSRQRPANPSTNDRLVAFKPQTMETPRE